MQIRFNLAFYLYVTLIMAQDAPKRRFLSLRFLVSCICKSFLIRFLLLLLLLLLLFIFRSSDKVTGCLEDLCLEQKRKESERERQRQNSYNTCNSSYLVEEVTPQILSLGTKPFVIFKDALF